MIPIEGLTELEAEVTSALRRRDHSALPILGFGEISVALGFPTDEPRFVCKRTPPLTPDQYGHYRQLVDRYLTRLRGRGLSVVDTEVLAVPRDDRLIGYLVQPLLAADTLGDAVLQRAEPDPEHPFLAALAETLTIPSGGLSIDAQVTNWSWDGTELTLLDVGTPFLWDDGGRLEFDMAPYLPMISAPLRSSARKDLTRMIGRWQEPSGVALDIVANLYREGLTSWVEPTLAALNQGLEAVGGTTVDVDMAREVFEEDLRTWPRLARLKRLERTWQTAVRRRHYDFFIQTTFNDGGTY